MNITTRVASISCTNAQSHNGICGFDPNRTSSNLTHEYLQLPTFTPAAKARVIITFVIFTLSAFCNLAALWAAAHTSRKKRSHVRILILNLTTADLLVTFIVMPLDAIWNITVQWQAGDIACRILMFLKLLSMYSCAFVTVVISIDRQSAILNPLGINEAKKKNKIMLSAAWLMSVVHSLPQLFLFHTVTITEPQHFTQCTTRGSFPQHWQETTYNMVSFVCLFLLPLLIMISCYSRILLEISRRMSKGTLSSKEIYLRRSKNNIPKARMRTLKMSIVIVSSFIICWTPYYLLGLWYWFYPEAMEEKVSQSLTHILFIFGLLNACLDPITYGLFTIHFRKGLQRYCRSGRTSDPDTSSSVTGSFRCSVSSFRAKKMMVLNQELQGRQAYNGLSAQAEFRTNGLTSSCL
ncbi:putative gonadotropin-releasing hormone II receptor [Spea bombifrons]|uniref:putative gonadotropin-releasing hormone II receptor n=1 Tax=Spea bombifrons TaxID=233779 RepID=UPI002349E7D7|nr:putative gonadotropin-releasing hormone II receptor [Spea bombifrons]